LIKSEVNYPVIQVIGIPPSWKRFSSSSNAAISSLASAISAVPFSCVPPCGPAILANLLRASPGKLLANAYAYSHNES